MAFKRGFKSQCERRAVEIRKGFGLSKAAPLDALALAKSVGATVWSTDDITELTEDEKKSLCITDKDSWSALTIRMGLNHLIIYKEVGSRPRVNSVVMHELSHILLGHELVEACILEDGSLVSRNYDQDQEDEANWLGGTLLLPRPSLLHVRNIDMSDKDIMTQYGVSREMLEWRVKMTGVDYQINYRRKKAG